MNIVIINSKCHPVLGGTLRFWPCKLVLAVGLLVTPSDSSASEVIGRHLNRYLVSKQNFDKVHPKFAGNNGSNGMTVSNVNMELLVGKSFSYNPLDFNQVTLRHRLSSFLWLIQIVSKIRARIRRMQIYSWYNQFV